MASTTRIVRVAARTTAGTQDITVPGLGASSLIKAVLLFATLASVDGVAAAGAALSVGWTNGGTQRVCGTCSRNGTTTPSAFSQANTTDVVLLLDPASADAAGPSVSVYGRAAFDSFITDGVRINWTTAPATAVYLVCVITAGVQAISSVHEFDCEGDPEFIVSPNTGFLTHSYVPQFALFASCAAPFDDTPVALGTMSLGAWSAVTMRQGVATWGEISQTPAANSVVNAELSIDVVRIVHADTSELNGTVVNNVGTTVGIDSDPVPCAVAAFAALLSDCRVDVQIAQTPGATETVTDITLRPQAVIIFSTLSTSERQLETAGDASTIAIGFADRYATYSLAIAAEDDIATTNTRSLATSHLLSLPLGDGSDVLDVDLDSLDDDGFTWTLAHGTFDPRICVVLGIGDAVSFSTSCGSSIECAPSGSGALTPRVDGASSSTNAASGRGAIAGEASGASDSHATASGSGQLAGETASSSETAAACGGIGGVSGIAVGSSQAAALLVGRGEVQASTTAIASCVAQLGGLGTLAGDLFATSMLFIDDGIVPEVLGVYRTIGKLARDRVIAGVQVGQSRGVAYDNLPFAISGTTAFVRAHVAVADGRQIEFGAGNGYRKSGELVARVHVPFGNTAAAHALEVANGVRDALTDVFVEHVNFRTAWIDGEGERDGGDWVVEVRAPFEADVVLALPTGAAPDGPLDPIVAGSIVRERMRDLVATPLSLTVEYGGVPEADHDADETWARFSVLSGRRFVAEPGAQKRYRTPGVFLAAVFTPVESGESGGVEIADAIADAFRAVSDRGVQFETPVAHEGRRDGPWWRVDVTCAFSWEELV